MSSKKEIATVPETISVLEMPSSVFRKAMATKTTPTKPAEMTAATCKMAATTTEASTMAAPSSAVSERGGGRNRQNTGQNQTGKETVK